MISRRIKKGIQEKLEIVAQNNGVSVEEVRRDIARMIHEGTNSPNAIIRARWAAVPREGEQPTVEEFLIHITRKATQNREG